MDNLITISTLNDFIFCPVSIYFHKIERGVNVIMTQTYDQLAGTNAHQHVDEQTYSDRRAILQGTMVYSEKYRLIGKIDIFDINKGLLTERKRKITTIYDGYIFQLYAQYFALQEMGYSVKILRFYSSSDNKVHSVLKPSEDIDMFNKFEATIKAIHEFEFTTFVQENVKKCERCIYEELCYFSKLKEDVC